jgi:hypothetical protein
MAFFIGVMAELSFAALISGIFFPQWVDDDTLISTGYR